MPITSHSSYTSSNSTSSSAMVRWGQRPQCGGLRKWGWGAKELSARPLTRLLPSGPASPRCCGRLNGARGRETAAPSSAGDRPGAGGGAGARELGRPGPSAARQPAAPRAAQAALLGVRILGVPAAPRSPLSACQSARAARPRPLPLLKLASAWRGAARATEVAAIGP